MKTIHSTASLLAVCALLASCVPTLHPFYAEGDTVFRRELAGDWTDGKTTWEFADEGEESYVLTYTERDGKSGEFAVHLVEAGGRLFLDLHPTKPEPDAPGYWNFHLIRAHTFLLVEQIEPVLKLRPFNPKWAKEYLAEHPEAIAHTVVGDVPILTAPTAELQAFALKHIETPEAFGEVLGLERVKE